MYARYPDVSERVPYEEYNEEIATKKVNTAKNIFASLKNEFKKLEEHEK